MWNSPVIFKEQNWIEHWKTAASQCCRRTLTKRWARQYWNLTHMGERSWPRIWVPAENLFRKARLGCFTKRGTLNSSQLPCNSLVCNQNLQIEWGWRVNRKYGQDTGRRRITKH